MTIVFYILAAALIFLSFKSFRGGIIYLNYFKLELSKPRSAYTPLVTVIAPCKGLDGGLMENLAVLLKQDYPNYEVIFVVDDEADEAVAAIKAVSGRAAAGAKQTRLVTAPKATDSSQKVQNLREAVQYVSEKSKAVVFVDSDARPNENWLRNLVAPLQDEKIGAATGYRWFFSTIPTFASEILSIWNASIASALGPNIKTNFCWGGSMAIRRDIFEKLDIREKWGGTLSDDFVVTQAMNEANLAIYFVPQALTASIENCNSTGLLEFTTRQMKIARVYASKLWLMSLFGSGLFSLVLGWSLFIMIFTRNNDLIMWAAISTLMLVSFFSIGKSGLRIKAAKLVFQEHKEDLNRQFWTHSMLWLLVPPLFFYNSVMALLSQKMTWRGITYKMISRNKTQVLRTDAKQPRF